MGIKLVEYHGKENSVKCGMIQILLPGFRRGSEKHYEQFEVQVGEGAEHEKETSDWY